MTLTLRRSCYSSATPFGRRLWLLPCHRTEAARRPRPRAHVALPGPARLGTVLRRLPGPQRAGRRRWPGRAGRGGRAGWAVAREPPSCPSVPGLTQGGGGCGPAGGGGPKRLCPVPESPGWRKWKGRTVAPPGVSSRGLRGKAGCQQRDGVASQREAVPPPCLRGDSVPSSAR